MRRHLYILPAILVLLLSVAPAAAARPEHTRLEPQAFTIVGSCPFDVDYEETRVSGHATTFFDRNGEPTKTLIRGNWIVRLTNVDTGETMSLNISGQFFVRGEFKVHGRNLLFHFAPVPILVLSIGNTVLDVTNGLEIVSNHGRLIDICAALA
jgi:hypothetical protein